MMLNQQMPIQGPASYSMPNTNQPVQGQQQNLQSKSLMRSRLEEIFEQQALEQSIQQQQDPEARVASSSALAL